MIVVIVYIVCFICIIFPIISLFIDSPKKTMRREILGLMILTKRNGFSKEYIIDQIKKYRILTKWSDDEAEKIVDDMFNNELKKKIEKRKKVINEVQRF